ncbi:hypothetical protein N9W96_02195 [Flavobacteriaceae bacterium]|nr:hypothetical protein [Flavobacteriaceae bacterium]
MSNPPHRPPRVFTEQEIKECFELSDVLSQKQLADYFGCTSNTLRAAFERQTELSEAYRKGKSLGITKVAKSLAAKALDGDVNAAKFYLSHQAGWTETKRTELSGRDGDPIEIDNHWTIEVVE